MINNISKVRNYIYRTLYNQVSVSDTVINVYEYVIQGSLYPYIVVGNYSSDITQGSSVMVYKIKMEVNIYVQIANNINIDLIAQEIISLLPESISLENHQVKIKLKSYNVEKDIATQGKILNGSLIFNILLY